jgi:hypothetical protein
MPSQESAVTSLGEAARAQLAMRLLDHDRLAVLDLETLYPTGRHIWFPELDLRHANALVDLVAVAENFSSQRLLDVHPELDDSQISTWDKRRREWRARSNVDLTSVTPNWNKLMGFVEARNAFQHGLGRLTDMQLGRRRDSILSDLAAAGISLTGDLVRVDDKTVRECHSICDEFIVVLDNAAQVS